MTRRLMNLPAWGVVLLATSAALAAGRPAAVGMTAGPPVTVKVEKMAFAVRQSPPPQGYSYLKSNPNLTGKETYTTEAVVLENEYVRAVVLPEFGARLVRVTYKAGGRDLFWVNDTLEDGLPWSTGGIRFSFPFYEYGRHMDEGAGWRIVRNLDGSATVAMDMRFTQYKGEAERYGRFSSLRQATLVTLRPLSALVEYTARIDNRLPLPHGFRLWSVAQFPRKAGAQVLLPTGAVTERGAAAMHPWPKWDDTDHSVLENGGVSVFAVDPQGDWAGVYDPDTQVNRLILKPRFTAPGTRVYASAPRKLEIKTAGARPNPMVEIWNGSNPIFDHPGHFLPPFGTYVLPLKLALVAGLGRVEWANDAVALACERGDWGATIRIVSFEVRSGCHVMARTKQETVRVAGTLRPDKPIAVELLKRAEPILVTVIDAGGTELAEVNLPWRPEPLAEDAMKTLQGEMKPWNALAMELSDWPHEDTPNLADAPKTLVENLTSDKVATVVQAARAVLRAEPPRSPRWQFIRSRLEDVVARNPKHAPAQQALGMMMVLEAGGKATGEAAKHFAVADRLPGGQYLLALEALASGKAANAQLHLKNCVGQAAPVAMGLGADATAGGSRLHPAATVGGEWPTLVRAAALVALEQPQGAIAALERLVVDDPARPEALALLADAYAKALDIARRDWGSATGGQVSDLAVLTEKARAAKVEADLLFRMNDEARRDYEAILREAREGVWAGIPRP